MLVLAITVLMSCICLVGVDISSASGIPPEAATTVHASGTITTAFSPATELLLPMLIVRFGGTNGSVLSKSMLPIIELYAAQRVINSGGSQPYDRINSVGLPGHSGMHDCTDNCARYSASVTAVLSVDTQVNKR